MYTASAKRDAGRKVRKYETRGRCAQPQMPLDALTDVSTTRSPSRMTERLTSRAQRLRDHASGSQVLEVPFRRCLILPSPEDPTRTLLESCHLGLDEVLDVVVLGIIKACDSTHGLASAVADVRRALAIVVEGAIVSCANITTVQPILESAGRKQIQNQFITHHLAQSVMAPVHSPAMVHLLFEAI